MKMERLPKMYKGSKLVIIKHVAWPNLSVEPHFTAERGNITTRFPGTYARRL